MGVVGEGERRLPHRRELTTDRLLLLGSSVLQSSSLKCHRRFLQHSLLLRSEIWHCVQVSSQMEETLRVKEAQVTVPRMHRDSIGT